MAMDEWMDEVPDEPEPERWRIEPWPWIVAGLLVFMIGVSVSFLAVAIDNPDPVVAESTR